MYKAIKQLYYQEKCSKAQMYEFEIQGCVSFSRDWWIPDKKAYLSN